MNVLVFGKVLKEKGLAGTILRTSFTNIIVLILVTLTSIITARLLGVEGKGELSAILFWPIFLTGLVSLGLPTSLIYNLRKDVTHTSDYLKVCILVLIPIGIVVGIIVWFCIPIWLQQYSITAILLAQIYTVITIPLQLSINLLSSLSKAIDKFHIYNGIKMNVPLLSLLGLLGLWLFGVLDLFSSALVYLCTTIIVLFYCTKSLKKYFQFNLKKISRKRTKPLFSYGVKVYGMELLGTLYNQADKIIIITLLTPRDFGLYTVVFSLSRIFNAVQNAITEVIFPKVTGMEPSLIITTVSRAFRISMIIMTIIIIPSLFVGQFFLGLLFGSQFLEASSTFYLLSIECIVGGGSWILASSFNAIGRPGMVLVRQIIAITITITLFFVLSPALGLFGVALALFTGAMVRLVITLLQLPRVFNVSLGRILFDRNDIKYMNNFVKEKLFRKGVRSDANSKQLSSNG